MILHESSRVHMQVCREACAGCQSWKDEGLFIWRAVVGMLTGRWYHTCAEAPSTGYWSWSLGPIFVLKKENITQSHDFLMF